MIENDDINIWIVETIRIASYKRNRQLHVDKEKLTWIAFPSKRIA